MLVFTMFVLFLCGVLSGVIAAVTIAVYIEQRNDEAITEKVLTWKAANPDKTMNDYPVA